MFFKVNKLSLNYILSVELDLVELYLQNVTFQIEPHGSQLR